jgi:hypothetical protein
MQPDPHQPTPSTPPPEAPSVTPQSSPLPGQPPLPQAPATSPYSIDYLNQIAPQPKKTGLFNNRILLFIVGGGVVLAAIIGALTLLSNTKGSTTDMQTLAARMTVLQDVSNKSQTNIKSTKLRNTNSNLALFLTNANRDIATPLKNNDVDSKKLDKKITQEEQANGKTLTSKLDDARLNAVFDRTYAREMSYQLSTVEGLMKAIYKTTKSKSMKTFLEQTDSNISPIIKQLDSFNTTTAND